MKKNFGTAALGLLMLLMISSCKKDQRALDMNVSAVSTLLAPANATSLNLEPGGAGLTFKWSAATAADGGLILYEVAFDKASGDFSKPVYRILSDGSGVQTQATIPADTLNKIASLAGVASSSTGAIKWTVMASKATNVQLSQSANTIQVTRPAGFAIPPTTLYLTGTATEAGAADISKSLAFKQITPGVFELYTSLQPGTYQLTDKASSTGTKYYLDDKGIIQQGAGTTTITAAKSAYRIRLNFNVATSSVVGIQSLGLFMSAYNSEIGQLSYMGNSTWENPKIPVTFYQFSWGRDERYKFVLHTSNGVEYLGSSNVNNSAPAGQPASYFYLTPVGNAQWDNTYKFDPSIDTHNAKVDVYFTASAPYSHTATAVN
ncbi:SusE domain-containing protein [Mucilaginibacter sp. KACC 22063]|uniref:SusE domain-containing protein n=1 Tax=Mucilaginibacter sp. KACC 22063 TaxID=3025666 RepID=UPI0023655194|nr:SusE domain-containing protein [Mucilaginibacter sp. KACC 22063]WDF57322.1 SusE domain-containing protein [Mucilaginibacter sp. KACC 22063]